jgi:hypothetical protein
MQQLIPNAKAQFIDQNGLPLASGTVGFYFPGTLNPKPTYQDAAGTITNTNPVLLDSRGQALIWGAGVYRQIVKDASGVTIWDQITEDPNAGLTGNMTNARWVVGGSYTDPVGTTPGTFVPGTTTTFNLPVAPGSISNIWPYFDAGFQMDDQIASLDGTTLVFSAAVPNGIQEVEVKIGTTVAIGTPSTGSITDIMVSPGAAISSSKLSFLQTGAGAVRRTVQSKLSDGISLLDFGAVGDDVADDTGPINLAISACSILGKSLFVPAPKVAYRTTATIPITGFTRIFGEGVEPYTALSSAGENTRGAGSWFHFDHTDKGFDIDGSTAPASISGISFKWIGTYRTQPAPNGNAPYTPVVCDWDFNISNADVFMDEVCLLNAYRGINLDNGNQGRLTIGRIFGQPLNQGIHIENSFDVCRVDDVHFWPYWSESLGVNTYTLTNGVAVSAARADTCIFGDIFNYGYNNGFLVTGNANGTLTCQISNLNIDDCYNGFVIDNSAVGARVNISNMTIQGASTDITGIGGGTNAGVICFGTNCNLSIKGIDFGFFGANAMNIGGSGNIVKISQDRCFTWNTLNAGFTGYNVQAGSTLIRESLPDFSGGNGAAIWGGAGTIKSPLDWGQQAGTTDAQGRLTINHNGKIAPRVVDANAIGSAALLTAQLDSTGVTAFTLRFFNSAGAVVSTPVSVCWDAKY